MTYDFTKLEPIEVSEDSFTTAPVALAAVQSVNAEGSDGKDYSLSERHHGGIDKRKRYTYCGCDCHFCKCNCNYGTIFSCTCDSNVSLNIEINFINGRQSVKAVVRSGSKWSEVKKKAPSVSKKAWVLSQSEYKKISPDYTFTDNTHVYAVDWDDIYIVDTGSTGNSWWRKYSDGWLVQGGCVYAGNHSVQNKEPLTINFPKEFRDTSYTHNGAIAPYSTMSNRVIGNNGDYNMLLSSRMKTTSSISFYNWISNRGQDRWGDTNGYYWFACGYGR